MCLYFIEENEGYQNTSIFLHHTTGTYYKGFRSKLLLHGSDTETSEWKSLAANLFRIMQKQVHETEGKEGREVDVINRRETDKERANKEREKEKK
jgi:hypothetical protein